MIKIITIFALALILIMPATASNVTKVEIHGVVFDEKSSTYNTTLQWDAQNFTGFYYNFNGGKSSETLSITQSASSLIASSRTIQKDNLFYNTSRTSQNYTLFTAKGRKVENGLNYNSTTNTFTKNTTGGYYAQLGWFGDRYVAVNGKANKLAKLIKEQKTEEKQTLKLGTAWDLGEGYNLTVESLDTTTSPRQAWLSLNKDGKVLDNKVVNEGEVYTYVEKSVSGESDVPIFVTYVESIFTGGEGMSVLVQLRYTWLISRNVLEVKVGDKFGLFEVKEANENYLLLYNKDQQIDLNQNTVLPLYGDLKFRVADKDTALRFYPILEKTAPGKYEIRGGAYDQTQYKNLVWDAQRFPSFYYNFNGGKSSETLSINQSASSLKSTSRTIQKESLFYNTSRTDQNYTVYNEIGLKVENGLNYNSAANTFTKSTAGGKYAQLGWFGERYVAVNGKANKLARLIKEQKKEEKQILRLGTTWNLGEGYNLTVEALDTRTSPRQASLSLDRNGKVLDTKVLNEGDVYTYIEKSVSGESDVQIFVTYVESIFTGGEGMSAFVQLRYTWLISQNVFEVKAGDEFGIFEVKEANENYLLLYNKDRQIDLNQNTVLPLYGDLKFKVADKDTALRFYPFIEQTIPSNKELKAESAVQTTTVPAITQTSSALSSSLQAKAPEAALAPAQTAVPVKTENNTSAPKQYWILFAIAGLVTTGYLVLRRD
ncbi:MAG: S-layer protein domain-containing protein [Candidatus Methanoperedens sp.]|nr:S-layer protein domain-containing protein [Candidatus Methanoperedens sp.]